MTSSNPLHAVAALAGLSPQTAASVLRCAPIAPDTRIRVMEAAASLDYVPDLRSWQARKRGRTLIGVLADDYTVATTHQMLDGLAGHARLAGCALLLFHEQYLESGRHAQDGAAAARCDGLVLIRSTPFDQAARRFIAAHPRCVVIGNEMPPLACPVLACDVGAAVRSALAHLARLGHRRIGYIADAAGFAPDSQQRQGYRQGLEEAGLAPGDALYTLGGASRMQGFDAARRLLRQDHPPTALVAVSDDLALGALVAVKSMGLQVPGDVSVVGIGDTPDARAALPPLTTLHVPVDTICQRALARLLRLADGAAMRGPAPYPLRLVERHSCAPPQALDRSDFVNLLRLGNAAKQVFPVRSQQSTSEEDDAAGRAQSSGALPGR